jgi:hypothetical protein
MSSVSDDLQSFSQFVELNLRTKNNVKSLDDLYAEWRARNPSPEQLEKDIRAVRASLRDMEAGDTGRPIEQFIAEFRQKKGI